MDKKIERLRVLVLGGNGFIGSQIVRYLAADANVMIGTRKQNASVNEITIRMQEMLTPAQWQPILRAFDVVVNSVGILRQRKKESYADVHTNSVAALANACQQTQTRLIQVSAIGLSPDAGSRFIKSKYAGEQAILNSGANAVVVRPSLLDGKGGYGAKWFRKVALWPVQFVMPSDGLVAPLQVADLGEAVANIVLRPQQAIPAVIELGGNDVVSIPDYLTQLRASKQRLPAKQIVINSSIVRVASHIFDVMDWTPLSFGHYELMQGFNVPKENWLPKLLGRRPSDTGWQTASVEDCVVC